MKTLLFVDDEPKVLQGLQRQLYGMRNEWTMQFANNGQQALEAMAAKEMDVIVTDMMMPGMDGAQLLTEVSKKHPNTVRIVLSGHADREAVLRLVGPAHQYLSKPCDADELRAAIARAFALRDLLANEQLKALATRVKTLPSLPALHQQLTTELTKSEPDLDRIGSIISRDIAMTTKILQLVNSAFFGLPQPVNNATEAVMYLGLATVRALVLSLHVFSQYENKIAAGFSLDGLGNHCWKTGVLAKRIARAERKEDKMQEQCFLAGLVHDVGRLVLAAGMPEEYAVVLAEAKQQNAVLWHIEQQKLGATHAEVGAYLLGLWGLPNPIIEAVAFHHRPSGCVIQEFSPAIAVHAADSISHAGPCSDEPGTAIDIEYLKTIGLADRVEIWKDVCSNEE
jgi:HD-like signal output (HDOD) protein/CheY-like chemotaxis protein